MIFFLLDANVGHFCRFSVWKWILVSLSSDHQAEQILVTQWRHNFWYLSNKQDRTVTAWCCYTDFLKMYLLVLLKRQKCLYGCRYSSKFLTMQWAQWHPKGSEYQASNLVFKGQIRWLYTILCPLGVVGSPFKALKKKGRPELVYVDPCSGHHQI